MSKLSVLLGVGVFWMGSWLAATSVRAESPVPEISAVRVIEMTSPDVRERAPVISSMALDPVGKFLAVVGDDHLVRVIDTQSGKIVHRWQSHNDWVKVTAFRPDGQTLATAGDDRRVNLWDVSAKTLQVSQVSQSSKTSQERPRNLAEQPQAIYALTYSPDSKRLAVAGFDDKVRLFETAQGGLLHEWDAPGQDIRALTFSPDGLRLAAAGRIGTVRIWDVESGQQAADIRASTRKICALAYSPDGKILAAAGLQRIVRLLDPATGKVVVDLPERPGEVRALCFCGPHRLASGGSTNIIHLWDVATRQERFRLVGHTGSITTLAFQANTGLLMSGGYDTTVRFWDIKTIDQNEDKVTKNPNENPNQEKMTRRIDATRAD
jgi:WD40 repeat protein